MPGRVFRRLALAILLIAQVAACAYPAPEAIGRASDRDVATLARDIGFLDQSVNRAEAARAARIAYDYPLDLARRYEITDPPIIHNMKVNSGLRPRGLCYHWADDLQARLAEEGFTTLILLRAIAGAESNQGFEHSTVVIAPVGGTHHDGIILDPWRHGGRLFWAPFSDDHTYDWVPRSEVFAMKRARTSAKRAR